MTLSILLVHGIGDNKKDWAIDIIRDLKKKTLSEIKNLVKTDFPEDADAVLQVSSVYWKDVFEKGEEELRRILDKAREDDAAHEVKNNPFLRLWQFIRKLLLRLQNKITTGFVGDIIGYLNADARVIVYSRITDSLNQIISQERSPLTFITHSLGTVIASDYIYDKLKVRRLQSFEGFHEKFLLENIFTVGSPLALFSLRYGGPETFQNPIHVESSFGCWLNIYDKDDPIGMPLKPLNEAYGKAVTDDVKVEAGVYGLSHIEYFTKSKTLDIIAKKLALDWARLNNRLSEADIAKMYGNYNKDLLGIAS